MDAQELKFKQMTEPPVEKLICKLAVPCIISMLVTSFYNMADTFFVGMLESNAATGAVGVVFSMMAIIQAVGFFFGQGSGTFISRALGEKHYDEANQMAATGFYASLTVGLLICVVGQIFLEPLAYLLGSTDTILPYTKDYLRVILFGAPWMVASFVLNNQLRFQGGAMYAMVGITTGAVLNIGLDYIFVPVLGLGAEGAAIATFVSYLIVYLIRAVNVYKFIPFNLCWPNVILNTAVITVQTVFMVCDLPFNYIVQAVSILLLFVLNFKYVKVFFVKILSFVKVK